MRPAFSAGKAATPSPYSSLAAAILAGVERFPEGGFLYIDRDGARRVSYRETLERAYRLVAGLRRNGMKAGDALLVTLADAADAVPAIWAAAIGGFIAVPFIRSAPPGAEAIPDKETAAFLKEVFGAFCVLADGATASAGPGVADFRDIVSGPPPGDIEPAAGNPDDLRFAIPTSGTTARPKLVGLSERAAVARWWPKMPDAAHARGFLSWTALGHVMGVGLAMPNLPLKAHLDATRFVATPLSWLDALEATAATHATMTNFGMSLLVRAIGENPDRHWRLDHVRKIGIGAEAISRRTCERFLAALLPFGLREDALILGYGLSECGPVVGGGTSFSGDPSQAAESPPELDRPTEGHSVRIVGDNGYLVREGEVGRIEVYGPTMTSGYLGDEAATAALFTPDRWLRTGDLGLLRDGKLTVVGREKEVVIVNARKYTCQEIEAALKDRTGLPEIYAAPFEHAGGPGTAEMGAPCAVFVVLRRPDDHSAAAIAETVRTASAEAFRFAPRTVALISQDDLPRTSLGKIRRMALPAMLADPSMARRTNHLTVKSPAAAQYAANGDVEARLARIWQRILGSESAIDRDADFFALGGDSLLALRMSFLVEDEFGAAVQIERFAAKLSISELARALSATSRESGMKALPLPSGEQLPPWMSERLRDFLKVWPGTPALQDGFIRRVGTAQRGLPIFWCMQTGKEARAFGEALGGGFPAYAMRSGAILLDYGTPLAGTLADRYVEELKRICPEGPLVIGGTCQGVNIALAMTRRLVAEGRDVRLLAAADCRFAELCDGAPAPVPVALFGAVRSKLSPFRHFHYPETGLRKLAPRGLRLDMIDAGYAEIMHPPAIARLASGLEAAIEWAASRQSAEFGKAAASGRRAALYRRNISSSLQTVELRSGESLSLDLQIENTSAAVWEAFDSSGLTVGNHWLSDSGAMVIWSDGRTPLTRRVRRGERIPLRLDVVAPHKPGRYLLEVDLVEEGICWFADVTSSPLQIPVHVLPHRDRDDGQGERSRRAVLSAVLGLAGKIPQLRKTRRRSGEPRA